MGTTDLDAHRYPYAFDTITASIAHANFTTNGGIDGYSATESHYHANSSTNTDGP
jgi:hypothetical protein